MDIRESGEMYLETILILSEEKHSVRSVDISERMGYSKPSVSRAVGILKDRGYIEIKKNGLITLTEAGTTVAEKMLERHRILSGILKKLGVSEETAVNDACRIEHVISDETFEAMKRLAADAC